jgi:hypothetical protein
VGVVEEDKSVLTNVVLTSIYGLKPVFLAARALRGQERWVTLGFTATLGKDLEKLQSSPNS